jgi:hypothetical protein
VGHVRVVAAGSGVLLVMALAAGCGSAPDPPPQGVSATTHASVPRAATRPAASRSGICATPAILTRLTVTRTDPFPQNRISYVFPAHVSSTNATDIATVARAACQQPTAPAGYYNCPADFGVTYAVTFLAGSFVVGTITADPAGCTSLTGLGPPRSAGPTFWDPLAVALGLPAPREYCDPFRGRLPGAPTSCGPLQ